MALVELTGLRVDVAVEVDVGVAQRPARDGIAAYADGLDRADLHICSALFRGRTWDTPFGHAGYPAVHMPHTDFGGSLWA